MENAFRAFGGVPKVLNLDNLRATVQKTEYASDVLFRQRAVLNRLFPRFVRHGMIQFNSTEVLRFLGKRLDANFTGKVSTDLRRRNEGIRLKHWVI